MIIKSLTGSFGKLRGETLELHPGLNVIEAPNESGKSTWCAFIQAMLYGVDSSAREKGGVLPAKVRYAPWSGAPMEGRMDIDWNGDAVTITRTTAQKSAPMRDFSAVYTGTGLPVPGLTGPSAGEQLTGASREVFRRTAFIGQGEIPVTGRRSWKSASGRWCSPGMRTCPPPPPGTLCVSGCGNGGKPWNRRKWS